MKRKGIRFARVLREERVPYLTERERAAVSCFLERLEAECAGDVQHVVLFGSKARGDHDLESDLDLLVVADDEQRLCAVARAAEDETGVLLQPLVIPLQQYQEYQRLRAPLYVNLRRDGVELWDEARWEIEKQNVPLDFVEGELRAMDEETRETIHMYLSLAHEALDDAHLLSSSGSLRRTLSCAYYACFYALSATLYAVGIVRSKHSGIQAALSQFLVRPALVEAEYKDIYNVLRKAREESDYELRFAPEPDEVAQLLEDAGHFVMRMEAFLREQGL